MATPARPFLGTEALSAGLVTRRALTSRHRRIFRNVYIEADAVLTPVTLAEAAWLFAGRTAALAGISAAALHGDKWLDRGLLPELMRADAGVPASSSTAASPNPTRCARSGACR